MCLNSATPSGPCHHVLKNSSQHLEIRTYPIKRLWINLAALGSLSAGADAWRPLQTGACMSAGPGAHLPLWLPFPALTHGRLGPSRGAEPGTKPRKDDGVATVLAGKENSGGSRGGGKRCAWTMGDGTKGKKVPALILSSMNSSSSFTRSPLNLVATYHLSPRL